MSKQTDVNPSLDQVLADYLKAVDARRPPDIQSILAEYPQWRRELEEFFAAQEEVARWTGPLQALCAGPSTLQDQQTLGTDAPGEPGEGHGEGRTIGDYELLAEIARGGMGVVYRARQKRVNRVVALKMILAGNLATALAVQRLRAEAEAAARLDHPHIVPIYEVGQHEGHHFFTMKLIEGTNLAERAGPHPAPAIGRAEQRQAAALIAKVARAVHYAHQHGILHRDLKPANILVDAQGEPHVTDFGLAKRVEEEQGAATLPPALTQSGAIVGTPSYMAPEQASGAVALTTAADTYSLGAVLFEVLTGRPPFRGDSPLHITMQVVENEPPRPRTLNNALDYDLETICLKCLEKDPKKRYESAQGLADDLERWLADEPILGRRTTRRERIWKWVKRHKFVSGLMGVTGGAAAALIVLAGFLWHNAELRADAVQDLGAARKELDKAGADLKMAHDAQQAARADVERLQKAVDAEKNNLKKLHLLAELEQARAREARAFADRIVYAADMQSAHAAARAADLPHLLRLLEHHRPGADREDLRGFEWRYLWKLANRAQYTLDAHVLKGEARAKDKEMGAAPFVAISPDGKMLATLGADDKIRLWELASGKPRGVVAAPAGLVTLDFTEDGKNLQAVSARGEVKFPDPKALQLEKGPPSLDKLTASLLTHTWDVGTMKHRAEQADLSRLPGHPSFFANPKGLNIIMLGAMLKLPEGIVSPVALARSPETKLLAIGGILTISKLEGATPSVKQEGVILLWDLAKNEPRALLKGHDSMVIAVAFAPDGSLASSSFDGAVKLWSADGKERATLARTRSWIFTLNFSPDGKRLLAGGADGVVSLWEAATGKLEQSLIGHHEPVASVAATKDGRTLASASVDGIVKTWDLATVAGPAPVPFPGTMHKIAFGADGKSLFAIDQAGVFRTLEPSTGKEIGKRPLLDANRILLAAAISRDGKFLAYYNFIKSAVIICDTATGRETHAPPSKGMTYALAFAPDGDTLAIGTGLFNKSGQVVVRRRSDGKELFRFEDFKHKVTALEFSADGKTLAAGSDDHGVVMLDAASGKVISKVTRPDAVLTLAFAPDGKLLAVADKTGVSFHQVQDGKETRAFPTYSHRVAAMAFSPDGKRLATGGGAGDAPRGTGVKLWDISTGRETIALGDPSAFVRGLAFSPDGTRLAAVAGDISIINNFVGQLGGKSVITLWETDR